MAGLAANSEEYRNLLTLQRALMARLQDPEITVGQLASVAMAIDRILERKRIMRNKPKPKDMDVSKMVKRTRSAQYPAHQPSFIELHEQPANKLDSLGQNPLQPPPYSNASSKESTS